MTIDRWAKTFEKNRDGDLFSEKLRGEEIFSRKKGVNTTKLEKSRSFFQNDSGGVIHKVRVHQQGGGDFFRKKK